MSLRNQSELDKMAEQDRYNNSSNRRLNGTDILEELKLYGVKSFKDYLQSPYLYYEEELKRTLKSDSKVLDLCCGDGIHTIVLAQSGASVVAIDIAEKSILLAKNRAKLLNIQNIEFRVEDTENLPFESESFDYITCVGSLSYVNFDTFLENTHRLLKRGGKLIILDSYNHNPIYRLNRYVHYLRGERTISTLKRMPTNETFCKIKCEFSEVSIRYFGIFCFLGGFFSKIVGPKKAKQIIDSLDNTFKVLKEYAFKVVIVAEK